MSERVQVRLISLLEEAANSFEQLETLVNRKLREIPPDKLENIELRSLERETVDDDNDPYTEMDHLIFIKFRADVETEEESS